MIRAALFALTAVALTACAEPEQRQAPAAPVHSALDSGTWGLIDLNGAAPTTNVRVIFKDGQIKGQAPCNAINGSYATGADFAVKAIVATKAACPALSEEQTFLSILLKANGARVADGVLTISTADGEALRFRSVL